MAISEKIRLKGVARGLGIEGYRTMSQDELKAAIEGAQGVSKPVKGKANPNGAKGKAATKTVVKGAAKGRAAPAKVSKGKAEVSTPAKKSTTRVAKGKASKSSPAKSTSRKTTPKASAAKGTAKRTASGGARVPIDVSAIDWTQPSNVGGKGKRKVVLDSLRRFAGDRSKVFNAVKKHALEWYPNAHRVYPGAKTKLAAAEHQTKWLIARVAYDYASKTGQHVGKAGNRKTTLMPHLSGQGGTPKKGKVESKGAAKGKVESSKGKATPAKGTRATQRRERIKKTTAKRTTAAKGSRKPQKSTGSRASAKTTSTPTRKPSTRTKAPTASKRTPRKSGPLAVKGA